MKFDVDRSAMADQLRADHGTMGGLQLSATQSTTTRHQDFYLDTGNYRILRQGYTLRVRQTPSGAVVTLKSLLPTEDLPKSTAPVFARHELELALVVHEPADWLAVEQWPAHVRQTLEETIGRLRAVRVIAHLEQTRDKRMLSPAETDPGHWTESDAPAVEMSIDEVQVLAVPSGQGQNTGSPKTVLGCFTQVEVEAQNSAGIALLEPIAEWMQSQSGLRPVGESKLQRALLLEASHPLESHALVAGVQPEMPMAEACRLLWREQFIRMVLNEAGVRYSRNIEYVHDMRVATRRARAIDRAYGAHIREKRRKRFLKQFRRTARMLGDVRDLDVALANLAARQEPATDKGLAQNWEEQRQEAHRKVVAWFNSKRYQRFIRRVDRFTRTPGADARRIVYKPGESAPRSQVRHVVPTAILRQFEQVRAYEVVLAPSEHQPLDYSTIHALRIDCKYLRYSLEFVRNLLGGEGEELIRRLKLLQDHLGELNDAVVAQELIQRRLAEAEPGSSTAQLAGEIAQQEAIIQTYQATVPDDLANFVAAETRQLLGTALARI